jgi:hypothetical protein
MGEKDGVKKGEKEDKMILEIRTRKLNVELKTGLVIGENKGKSDGRERRE